MKCDAPYQQHRERLRRVVQQIEALLAETNATLDTASEAPTAAAVSELERLRAMLEDQLHTYLQQNNALLGEIRERASKMEEANLKSTMAEKSSRPARDEARIQELSEELTTKLRLERIDAAIKEVLDFLADAEFFSANASTGRRR